MAAIPKAKPRDTGQPGATQDPAVRALPTVPPTAATTAATRDGRVRVLVAEDDRLSREMIERTLTSWNYDVTTVADGARALALLVEPGAPRLALLDWEMPGLSGVEVCRLLRAREESPYVYVVLGTSHRGQRRVVDGLSAGADDYVTKPFELAELEVRLRAGRRVVLLQEQLMAASAALAERALVDSLTRVNNRGAIVDVLAREVARTRRTDRPLSVILADIDRFKDVNDTNGHPAGDAVLQEFARRAKGVVRSHDDLGRWGGEEFLIVAPACSSDEAGGIAERIRLALAREPVRTHDASLSITASFGVAGTDQGYCELNELVSAADTALYAAKGAGRNRVVLAARRLGARVIRADS